MTPTLSAIPRTHAHWSPHRRCVACAEPIEAGRARSSICGFCERAWERARQEAAAAMVEAMYTDIGGEG